MTKLINICILETILYFMGSEIFTSSNREESKTKCFEVMEIPQYFILVR